MGRFFTDPDGARSIVRHELSHVSHGDIDTVFAAFSLWWGYLLFGLLPVLLAAASQLLHPAQALEITTLLPVTAVLFAQRNLAHHDAEHRADLASGVTLQTKVARSRWPTFDWLSLHPSDAVRLEVLADPTR